MKKLYFLTLLLLQSTLLFAQKDVTVSGVVTDAADGQPLIGVVVIAEHSSNSTMTDIEGAYEIKAQAGETLVFNYAGMITEKIAAPVDGKLNVAMKADAQSIDEVVVIGYGVQKKKLTTGATSQIKGDNITKLSTISPIAAIQSQAPGVNITQNSGLPGQGFNVVIRGMGTTGNSSPLYVIDGVPGADINALNTNDIESMDILKDAASAAIYGARAANGVILITTKQGKQGKVQTSYSGYYGIQNIAKSVQPLNAMEYMQIQDEVNANEGLALHDWQTMMPELYAKIQNGWAGTNWLKEGTNKNAPMQNHAITISGGGELSQFSLGLSYSDQKGVIGLPQPFSTRYNARVNSTHVLARSKKGLDVLKFGENLVYSYSERQGQGIGNMNYNDVRSMINMHPLMPLYNDKGGYFDYEDMKALGIDNFEDKMANPIAMMDYERSQNINKNHTLNASMFLELQPIKNLIIKSQFGYKYNGSSFRSYKRDYSLSSTQQNSDKKVTQSMNSGFGITWENTIAYSKSIEDHSFSALVGQSIEKSGFGENMNAANVNYIFDDFDHAYLGNTGDVVPGKTEVGGLPNNINAIASFFGRLNYNYKEKYMISATVRADGSSNFAPGYRWGVFPSVSAGWVITNEPWMRDSSNAVSFLKLRASWGQNGNANIPGFQYLSTIAFDPTSYYSFGNIKDGQSLGAFPNILPNPELTWETSEQINVGIDARFLRSRLGVNLDWYRKSTINWLVRAPQLASFGTGAPFINGGDVINEGVEVALNWSDSVGEFYYSAYVNAGYNRNEITRIANEDGIIWGQAPVISQGTGAVYRAQVGMPIGYFYGYSTAGIFQNQSQIDATPVKLQENAQPGDVIFVDRNGDGVINEDDKGMIGKPQPDWTLGVGVNFEYKGFDLAITGYGAFGGQVMQSYRSYRGRINENYTTDIFNRWHGEGTSNRQPRLMLGSNVNYEVSDLYVENSDFFRIQNVTLGYDFAHLIKNGPFNKLRLYVAAQNLFTFTNYSGMDPEVGYGPEGWSSGIDLGFYPSPRTFMLGINFQF